MNKFRKRLRELGMESEFVDWMKKPVSPRKFKVGDRVKVIKEYKDSVLNIKLDSIGIVEELGARTYDGLLRVKFSDYEIGSQWLFRNRFVRI